MINISGFGASVYIVSTEAFPFGFSVTQFADDADPLIIEPLEAKAFEMLLDGSLYAYQKANPVKVTVNVIPGTEDDINLKQLVTANKGLPSFLPLPETVIMTLTYPSNGTTILSNGTILSGPVADSIHSGGRMKGNPYTFAFGSVTRLNSATDILNDLGQVARSLF